MNRKQKRVFLRILVTAVMLAVLAFLPVTGLLRLGLYLIPYFLIGYDILWKALRGIGRGQLLDEDFLMAIATVGALVLGAMQTGDYLEAIAVMLLYQVGELFQSYAVGKSRKSIAALMDIRPDYANIEQNGTLVQADPEDVAVGTVIVVQPGERVPLDGIVVEGKSVLNTVALTGESQPRDICPGEECISGCVNMTGILKLRTTKVYGESTVARILELVENAGANKARSEKFISKFARVYTPAVCISALALAVLPPAVSMLLTVDPRWSDWLYRALTFLVASCPCALVLSIPLTFFAGIGGAGKQGILIKGANFMETLAKTKCVVFDKTGTLTQGSFTVTKAVPRGISGERLLEYAALAESASSHPISKSLQAAYGKAIDRSRVSRQEEYSGKGVAATVDGIPVRVGNAAHLGVAQVQETGTVVHVSVDGEYAGYLVISDTVKPGTAEAIRALKKLGVEKTVMLTGDAAAPARQIAKEVGIKEYYAQLLPGDKVAMVEQLLSQKANRKLAFAGDGINDAPVLTRADVGIAMGALGSDAAIEAADVVLMDDDPRKLAAAISLARKCMAIVMQNIVFSLVIKIGALVLVALGLAGMWLAIFADVGVMILAVLNAIRALYHKL